MRVVRVVLVVPVVLRVLVAVQRRPVIPVLVAPAVSAVEVAPVPRAGPRLSLEGWVSRVLLVVPAVPAVTAARVARWAIRGPVALAERVVRAVSVVRAPMDQVALAAVGVEVVPAVRVARLALVRAALVMGLVVLAATVAQAALAVSVSLATLQVRAAAREAAASGAAVVVRAVPAELALLKVRAVPVVRVA